MDSQVIAQRDFSAGQIDPTSLRRDDTEILRAGLRKARNVRLLNTGAMARRPGRRVLFATTGLAEIVEPVAGHIWYLEFLPNQARFRNAALTVSYDFVGMPWGAGILDDMRFVESGSSIIIAHQSFRPQIFSYNRLTQTWSQSGFAFAQDPSLAIRQPYHNFFLGSGVTMQPSARTGIVTVTFSAPVLNAGHVGVVFRYAERQMTITAVASGTSGTASLIEDLPPTFAVSFDNTAGLRIGDVVEGLTSGARGQVVGLSGTNADVLLTKNWNGFEINEYVIGPRSRMKVSSQTSVPGAPGATVQWDEALMSDYRGWPGCVNKDQQRVVFCDFPQIGSAVTWSATGTLNDFNIGADKDDAIFEFVPENCRVLDIVVGADEMVFTDKGPFYIPVSTTNPLIPGSIEFRKISNDAAARVRPRETTDGLVYVNAGRSRVLAIIGTGQTARPYIVDDITEFHAALIKQPKCLATTSADASAPERYLYALNGDGTQAVARYQRQTGSRGWVGWVPWDGRGTLKWMSSNGGDVLVTAEYDTPQGTLRFAEIYDQTKLFDASQVVTSPNWSAGITVAVEKNGWYRGEYPLPLVWPAPADAGMVGGFDFDFEAAPFVPHVEGGSSRKQRLRPRRIKQVGLTVQRSQALRVAGYLVPFYRAGENEEQPPPLRDETYRTRVMGRSFDPQWSVTQEEPGALTIVEMTTEVTI